MTRCYTRCEGVLIEPIGHAWAVFSPVTGETALLNDESVAILEVLDNGAGDTFSVSAMLAEGDKVEAESIATVIEAAWPRLIESGLVRAMPAGSTMPR